MGEEEEREKERGGEIMDTNKMNNLFTSVDLK